MSASRLTGYSPFLFDVQSRASVEAAESMPVGRRVGQAALTHLHSDLQLEVTLRLLLQDLS